MLLPTAEGLAALASASFTSLLYSVLPPVFILLSFMERNWRLLHKTKYDKIISWILTAVCVLLIIYDCVAYRAAGMETAASVEGWLLLLTDFLNS
jgi:hypothetical protein